MILIFIAGLVLGALAAFVFVFIVMGVTVKNTTKKKDEIAQNEWRNYIKETRDDGK